MQICTADSMYNTRKRISGNILAKRLRDISMDSVLTKNIIVVPGFCYTQDGLAEPFKGYTIHNQGNQRKYGCALLYNNNSN